MLTQTKANSSIFTSETFLHSIQTFFVFSQCNGKDKQKHEEYS